MGLRRWGGSRSRCSVPPPSRGPPWPSVACRGEGRLPGDSSCCSLAASPRRGVPPLSASRRPPLGAPPSSVRSLSSVAKLTSDRLPSAEAGAVSRTRGGSGAPRARSTAGGKGGGGGVRAPPGAPCPARPHSLCPTPASKVVLSARGKLRLPLFTSWGAAGGSRRLRPAQVVWRCRAARGRGGAGGSWSSARGRGGGGSGGDNPVAILSPPPSSTPPPAHLPASAAAAGAAETAPPPAPRCAAWPSAAAPPGCWPATCSPAPPATGTEGGTHGDTVRTREAPIGAPSGAPPSLSPCCSIRR